MITEAFIKCGKCLMTLVKTDENDHAFVCEMSWFPCPWKAGKNARNLVFVSNNLFDLKRFERLISKIYGCEKIGSKKFIRNHLSECTGTYK